MMILIKFGEKMLNQMMLNSNKKTKNENEMLKKEISLPLKSILNKKQIFLEKATLKNPLIQNLPIKEGLNEEATEEDTEEPITTKSTAKKASTSRIITTEEDIDNKDTTISKNNMKKSRLEMTGIKSKRKLIGKESQR